MLKTFKTSAVFLFILFVISTFTLTNCLLGDDIETLRLMAGGGVTVIFDANGAASGTAPAPVNTIKNTSITLPGQGNLTRTGYSFGGWNTAANGSGTGYAAGSSYTVTENVTLYAEWNTAATITYTVTFNANGSTGGTAPATMSANQGANITLPGQGNLVKTGYLFGGWNTSVNGSGTTYAAGSSYTVTGNVTLYAKWDVFNINMEMVQIDPGTFTRNGYTITLTSGFYMGKYEVTQQQYQAVMGNNPSSFSSNQASGEVQGRRPVESVRWYDAIVFCNKLSMAEGLTPAYRINNSTDPSVWGVVPTSSNATWDAAQVVAGSTGYRLPTEAQWEYACRAGTTTTWSFGNNESDLTNYAWYDANSNSMTHEVGKKLPNAWELYDMHGNVWEWCWDWSGSLPNSAQTDPTGAVSGSYRLMRGGGWIDSAEITASANRGGGNPYGGSSWGGVRLLRPNTSQSATTYTVTFNANSATGGTAPSAMSANQGASITLPGQGNLTRTGYTFGGWNTSADGSGTPYAAGSSYTVTGNATLYAKWDAIINTVTFNANGSTGGIAPATMSANQGASITLPYCGSPFKTGYAFAGWNTSANGNGTTYAAGTSYTVIDDITLYVKWDVVNAVENMVWINPGTFTRNSYTITLTSGFYMGKYTVTQEQYQAVMGNNPSYFSSSPASGETQSKRPVEQVSWYDAIVFCNKLSISEGLTPAYSINGSTDPAIWGIVPTSSSNATWDAAQVVAGSTGYRLPTEAQWEYACRAGTTTTWSFGDNQSDLTNYAWYWDNSNEKTHEVGKKLPNAWGLYDMHGNVWEWCWDWWGSLPNTAQIDPTGAASGSDRLVRGGGWYVSAEGTASADRGNGYPDDRLDFGFRLLRP